jgi:hypothetical protein
MQHLASHLDRYRKRGFLHFQENLFIKQFPIQIQTGDKLSNETVYRLLVYTALGLAQGFPRHLLTSLFI